MPRARIYLDQDWPVYFTDLDEESEPDCTAVTVQVDQATWDRWWNAMRAYYEMQHELRTLYKQGNGDRGLVDCGDIYDDEDDQGDRYRWPTFRECYPDFDDGEVQGDKIYPIEHGPDCKGHSRGPWYSEEYKWSYIRVPSVPFRNDPNVVWPKEEYL